MVERALVDRYRAGEVGGRWDAGGGCAENYYFKKLLFKALETLFFIMAPSQNGSSTLTSHQSPHKSIILYLSTGI